MSRDTKYKGGKAVKAIVVAIVLLLVGGGVFFVLQYMDLRRENNELRAENTRLEEFRSNPEAAQAAEVQGYIDAVGELYALPDDEEPSVATVRDKDQLADQPFFERAENGDITLIYTRAQVAILYRPSTNQLVNVSTVSIQDEEPAQSTGGQSQNNED